MARGSLLNTADQAVSRVVLGSVDRMMQPQAQGGNDMPQQAPQQYQQPGAAQGGAAMPQQLPGMAAGANAPVMLRPWNERNAPAADTQNFYNAPAPRAPVQQIPAGDAAFVF